MMKKEMLELHGDVGDGEIDSRMEDTYEKVFCDHCSTMVTKRTFGHHQLGKIQEKILISELEGEASAIQYTSEEEFADRSFKISTTIQRMRAKWFS
jgi:hypothetical protein